MYNKKKRHAGYETKPHYKREDQPEGQERKSPEASTHNSGGSPSDNQGTESQPRRKNKKYYSRNKKRRPEQNKETIGNEQAGSGQPQQKDNQPPQGDKRKKSGYWQNRRKKNNQNRNKQNQQKVKGDNKSAPRPLLKHPVYLPEDIQTMEPLEDSILNFKAVDSEEVFAEEAASVELETVQDEAEQPDEQKNPKAETVDSGAICPVCNTPIRHLNTAIWHKEEDIPAHFDCVIKELVNSHKENLGKHRRIYYIGAGKFAIVKEQFDKKGRLKNYQVLERIEYERSEN